MHPGDFTNVPNPFATVSIGAERPRRRAAAKALKFLVLVAVCFALTIGISVGSRHFLLNRLTANFAALDSGEQKNRLVQIADLAPLSIPFLADALAVDDIDVARTAYDLLRGMQNDWTVLSLPQQRTRHSQMVAAIGESAVRLPDDRTGWAVTLLQQTIHEMVARTDAPSRALYQNANDKLELLTLSGRAGPSILADEPLDPARPKRLAIQSQPLPVDTLGGANADPTSDASLPSIYKSAAMRLQPVQPDEVVLLREVQSPNQTMVEKPVVSRETAYSVTPQPEQMPVAQATLVDSAMQAYDDVSVIHWLSSQQEPLREQAKLELLSRGYTQQDLQLATRIATADLPTRLDLVDLIAREPSIDPRPWLWMMSRDEHRDVRMRVVSVIGTMNDAAARSHLQTLMSEESDPIVATRIRRALGLSN
ncbi:hypothetical protein K227x_48780 [Rubripirellula lacrimiformis]|uniref:HEAT repeat protein n=1 Tax=Rubripirellula lacrimiformis TaxID=1930273 RepID=A0A517NHB6_9BACT|nr:hypothetical protein [Rubripirellula lacrimiformis]QDT06468.1 hypothetical protein K227x_48780 [Rubripirellula lacrimiformis]